MNDQNFGARVLFTALGVGMTLFWGEYFSSTLSRCVYMHSHTDEALPVGVSRVEPYRRLSLHPQPAQTSVLVSPPTTVFTGLAGAILRKEWFIAFVGLATIVSEFLPILLSLIPFSPSQTWLTHRVCAWTTVGCLSFMILVLAFGAVFIRYPYMNVDPASLAGRMYYVCDSAMSDDFQGMATASQSERAQRAGGSKMYRFGRLYGVSGERRIGVDYEGGGDESDDIESWKADRKESWRSVADDIKRERTDIKDTLDWRERREVSTIKT